MIPLPWQGPSLCDHHLMFNANCEKAWVFLDFWGKKVFYSFQLNQLGCKAEYNFSLKSRFLCLLWGGRGERERASERASEREHIIFLWVTLVEELKSSTITGMCLCMTNGLYKMNVHMTKGKLWDEKVRNFEMSGLVMNLMGGLASEP